MKQLMILSLISNIYFRPTVFVIGTEILKEMINEDGKLAIHDFKEEAKDDDVESGVEDEPE